MAMAKDLSVIIPARNEVFLKQTVENVLANSRADTEVIAVCDGNWPDPPLENHPRLKVIFHPESVGQRAATNDGAKLSRARFIMKLDAHCAVDEGFDVKLMADFQPNWTIVPSMYSLHAFDWRCTGCGKQTYQGAKPERCADCQNDTFEQVMIWQRRSKRHVTVLWCFDQNLQFQYWSGHRDVGKDPIIDTMSFIGACMFLERERFWKLGGMDENHGSWGQFGTEWACKTWLSGGRLVTTRNTWFAHMFRTGNFAAAGHSTWPYPISQNQIERARTYSRDFWTNDKWPLAKYPLSWLVEKFKPVPGWHT